VYQLQLRDLRLVDIARDRGLSRWAAYFALRHGSRRVEREIAHRLGLRPEQLWPERYLQERGDGGAGKSPSKGRAARKHVDDSPHGEAKKQGRAHDARRENPL